MIDAGCSSGVIYGSVGIRTKAFYSYIVYTLFVGRLIPHPNALL